MMVPEGWAGRRKIWAVGRLPAATLRPPAAILLRKLNKMHYFRLKIRLPADAQGFGGQDLLGPCRTVGMHTHT